LDGSCYWVSPGFFLALIDAVLAQLKRAGFQAVFADGHGPSRRSWVANLAEREARFGMKLFGVTAEIAARWQSQVDHAAGNETSLVMALYPQLVDLSQLSVDRSVWPQGVGGEDPRDASAEHGQACLENSIALVKSLFEQADLL